MTTPLCAKCSHRSPSMPREQPRWCARCYTLPSDPEATGGSLFSVESKTGWRGGRVAGAPRPREEDARDGGVDDREDFGAL